MNRIVKTLRWAALAGLLLAAVLVGSLVAMAGPLHSTLIQINGEPVTFAHLGVGEGLVAVAAVVLAMLIVLLVVPFAVLLPLAIVALVLVGVLVVALGAVAGAAALLFSPLILLAGAVWLVWRMVRSDSPKNATATDATMPR
ncbi:MAG: hypothetical protein KGI87_08600 [Burkholderiales bacterium]|nr:hypothetical protein [Burkholderiales bacterium]